MIDTVTLTSAAQTAIAAYVICEILIEDGHLLGRYLVWLQDMEAKGGLSAWIAKPLGLCVLCFSGQLALWHGAYMLYGFDVTELCSAEKVEQHILYIIFTIFITKILISVKWLK